ncbi:MAG: hypothetical protein V3T05_12920 [Myxococcota bacterium]
MNLDEVRNRRRDRIRRRIKSQASSKATLTLMATFGGAGLLVFMVLGGLGIVRQRIEGNVDSPPVIPIEKPADSTVILTLPSLATPTIRITADAISVNDDPVVALSNGRLPSGAGSGPIPALRERLAQLVADGARRCILTAEPEISFRTLSLVHATAINAGLDRVELRDATPRPSDH